MSQQNRPEENPKKRKTLTKAQKKELCEKKRDNPNIKGIDLAQEYDISTQSVSDILKQSSQWLNYDESSSSTSHLYRNRTSDYPDIEEATIIWVDQLLARDLTLSGSIIQEKAREFANIFEINNFNASSGWLAKFKNRNNLHSFKKRGGSMSAPIQEIAEMQLQLQEILREYSPNDIWNCDKTALFWRLEPNRTIAHAPLLGRKRPKDRITAMLTCSSTGEKLPVLFIHKHKNPRPLRGIEKNSLPVWYYWNTKAWMQRSIFKHYLERFNSKMVRQNRNIILLLDNASSHNAKNIPTLSNIKVHFLPPNTTSILQPLDQGIIYSLKSKYRKILCVNRIRAYQEAAESNNNEVPLINIFNAINFVSDAWNRVTTETIKNSWEKTKIINQINQNTTDLMVEEDQSEINEINSLITQLPFQDCLNAKEYVTIDQNLLVQEEMTTQEIVNIVKRQSEVDDDDETNETNEPELITNTEAIKALETVLKYVEQNNLDIDFQVIKNVKRLKSVISYKNSQEQVQTRMEDYYYVNVE